MENQSSPPPRPAPPPPPPRKRKWFRNLLILMGLIALWVVLYENKTPTQNDTTTKTAGNASGPVQKSTQRDAQSVKPAQKSTQSDTVKETQGSEALPQQTTGTGDAKPAATDRLKLIGAVKIRSQTPGCEDIDTALNTPVAERKATEGQEIMGSGDSTKLKEWLKSPTCQFVGGPDILPGGQRSYATWNSFEVRDTVLPPLPPGKVAYCVSGMFIVNPNTPQTRCHWVIVSAQDVCRLSEPCWDKW